MAVEKKEVKQDKGRSRGAPEKKLHRDGKGDLKPQKRPLYKKEQVPEFMVKRILEAGRFAPSAGNCQPWKFVVVREPKIIHDMTNTSSRSATFQGDGGLQQARESGSSP